MRGHRKTNIILATATLASLLFFAVLLSVMVELAAAAASDAFR